MKKRVLLGGVLFVALCVLAGIGYFGKKMIINFIETETREAPKKEDKAEKKEQLERETLYEEILNHCTADFIGEKPINDNFLSWLHSAYGEEVIEEIAKESKKSRQDRNLWYSLTGNSIQVLWIQYCRDTGYQLELLENVYERDCADTEEIVLDFTGDVNLAEGWSTTKYMDQQENGIYDCLSANLVMELQGADILMVNNEYAYSDRGYPLPGKTYTFRAMPTRVQVLQQIGTDVVSLANNHVYDYGEDALLDTLETLENVGIPYVGAGRNLKEAEKIVYFIANGRKIAIVAATQIERFESFTKEAEENTPGVLKTLEPDKFVRVIREAKKNSDYVIAYPHWGTEGTSVYGLDQRQLAEAFAEAGADVIIGGHTHSLQGIDYIGDVPVFYSLGNFWFNGKTIDTGVAQVRIQKDGSIRPRFLPCLQSGCQTELLEDGEKRDKILEFMRGLSKGVEIDEKGDITNLGK